MMFIQTAAIDVTPVPNWLLHAAAAAAMPLIGTIVFLVKAWIKLSTSLVSLEASADALHRRVDKIENLFDEVRRKVIVREEVEERVREETNPRIILENYKKKTKPPRDDEEG